MMAIALHGQQVNIFHEKTATGFELYAANEEFFPVSLSLELELNNLVFSEGQQKLFVLPARNTKFKLGELTQDRKNEPYRYRMSYLFAMGSDTLTSPDTDMAYDLPFATGKRFIVFQGYNGQNSHRNENALDFSLPLGSEVLAAREGTVVQVVHDNNRNCPEEECKKFNNYVTILHADGTFAQYHHIQQNGSKVHPGDTVNRGEVIALSGNVGWSTGPHLHFVCFLGGFQRRTLETKFRVGDGTTAELLQEGKSYHRGY